MYNLCVFTGARSEYGVLRPLLKKIKSDSCLNLQLVVSGSHLSPEFGLTIQDIINDEFEISDKVEILLSSDTTVGISKSMGLAMISLSECYERLKPDLLIVLGDRYEAFCAISVATIGNIPIAHISGGDVTEGAYDDAFRHSMTKMSYIHFPGNEESARRIVQLGENPNRIYNVGEPGLENIKNMIFSDKQDLFDELGMKIKKEYFVIVFHPTTLEGKSSKEQFNELLGALDKYKARYDFIFIKSNADSDSRIINSMIDDYIIRNENSYCFESLKVENYLNLLKNAKILIGNSSSGIIEAPSFKIPTINIGDRQKGRIRASSVLDCVCQKEVIVEMVEKSISREFQEKLIFTINPYGDGETSEKIMKVIKEFLENKKINLKKGFYDLDFEVKNG